MSGTIDTVAAAIAIVVLILRIIAVKVGAKKQ